MKLNSFDLHIFTELANTMKYAIGDGVLYDLVFSELPFKTVTGDVTAELSFVSQTNL